jgi:hypothetical protein
LRKEKGKLAGRKKKRKPQTIYRHNKTEEAHSSKKTLYIVIRPLWEYANRFHSDHFGFCCGVCLGYIPYTAAGIRSAL